MIEPRCIPALLLAGSSLVKTVRFRDAGYIGDPVNTVNIFSALEADEVILLDITATADGRPPNYPLIRQIANEAQVPFAYGGGIKTVDEVRGILALGAEKVVISTSAIERPHLIESAASLAGSQAIIVSVDVAKAPRGERSVYTRGGTTCANVDPVSHAVNVERLGAGEILLVSVDRDGTFTGYDLPLIRDICSAVRIPVIACGGAGARGDLRRAIVEGGASAAAAGSIFVYQKENRSVVVNYPSRAELRRLFS